VIFIAVRAVRLSDKGAGAEEKIVGNGVNTGNIQ
jgi:hypothetical protein